MIIRINRSRLVAGVISVLLIAVLCAAAMTAVSSQSREKKLPIVMYHQIRQDGKGLGRYVLDIRELENDLLYLKRCGYTAVNTADLINYVYYGSPLPEKPIVLSFDDGCESIYALVSPLMKKHGMKCVAAVIGSLCECYTEHEDHNIAYSYMTWQQVKQLSRQGEVEIHSHSYAMHEYQKGKRKGMQRMDAETDEQYESSLYEDLQMNRMKLLSLGAADNAMVYPYGSCNKTTEKVIRSLGYRLSFTCEEKVNTIRQGDKNSLFLLGRYNRPSGIPSEQFFAFLREEG